MRDRLSALALVVNVVVALTACRGTEAQQAPVQSATAPANPTPRREPKVDAHRRQDLSVDESMGGHTLARHVGKTDAELADRLHRERQISAASTYSDRVIAERTVWSALDADASTVSSWQRRSGRRPNLALHYADRSAAIGRSLFRGAPKSVPCNRAVVVLKWDDRRDRSFVLTSYPDCTR